MKYKIGVFGSNVEDKLLSEKSIEKTQELANILNKKNVILITGACSGLPYKVASRAAKKETDVWGFSPELNILDQKKFAPNDDFSIYKKLIFVPKAFPFFRDSLACKKYRNVMSTATCDAGIIISGRWGTMNEFTNLYDMGKVIGVLTGTGGVADELEKLDKKIKKKSKAKVFFNSSPKRLIKKVIDELQKRKE